MIFVIMGVCGSGKSTIAKFLAEQLRVPYAEADDFHSESNKQKMSQCTPLTDEDRWPWLLAIHAFIKRHWEKGHSAIVTCSALKRVYRDVLRTGQSSCQAQAPDSNHTQDKAYRLMQEDIVFVHLKGSEEVLQERMMKRKDHFMPAGLLKSQCEILEEPQDDENHVTVDVNTQQPPDTVKQLIQYWSCKH